MSDLYIGIMSGTSIDAVDAIILDTSHSPKVIASTSIPFPDQLRQGLTDLITNPKAPLADIGYLNIALARLYVEVVEKLLLKANISREKIKAIGCHGQTVYHQPEGDDRFSLQLGSGSYLAEKTSITSITDFRNRDMAAGGQGAPLVPAFHEAIFHDESKSRLIINIGGIANCTWLPGQDETIGFDIGPGNTLMDSWIYTCTGQRFDKDGLWASQGEVSPPLLKDLLADNYFKKPAPKSTGREYFNLDWLENIFSGSLETIKAEDIQATLLQLTAHSIADVINQFQPDETCFCGGGVYNLYLIQQIKALCSDKGFIDIEDLGIQPDQVEAAAFAWLAMRCLSGETGTLTAVTGAQKSVIAGAIYQA